MSFSRIQPQDIKAFSKIVGKDYVHQDEEQLTRCASDQTEDLRYMPEVVLQPGTPEEISAILRYCGKWHIPVTPRGAGTGLSGGALPVYGGVLLDTKRFNKILHLDEANFQVTTEPGVITQELMEFVKERGLMYPPDPASKGSCFIGGNVSENSGCPKAGKYGVVKS